MRKGNGVFHKFQVKEEEKGGDGWSKRESHSSNRGQRLKRNFIQLCLDFPSISLAPF